MIKKVGWVLTDNKNKAYTLAVVLVFSRTSSSIYFIIALVMVWLSIAD